MSRYLFSALLHFQKNGLQAQVDHINTCMKEITELSKKIKIYKMGCFNNSGFYSHLPITYGDEIVLIPMYYGKGSYDGISPETFSTSQINSNLYPLCFPIKGKYDDYGFIKDVKEDFNTNRLKELLGEVTFDDVLEKHIKHWNRRTSSVYKKLLETVQTSDNRFDIEEANIVLSDMQKLNLTQPYSRLTYGIELRSVYESIINIHNLEKEHGWFNQITYGEYYDRIMNLPKDIWWFTHQLDYDEDVYEALRIIDQLNGFEAPMFQFTQFFPDGIEPHVIRKDFFEFTSFLMWINQHGGVLMESKYHSQDVNWKEYLQYKHAELLIIRKSLKKQQEDEESDNCD